jgi:hypothetical protein
MDIVIPFVDCKDKVWVKTFLSKIDKVPQYFSYRNYYDYGLLKYTLRGINSYMPYVDNVFLIVSSIEQVPWYINLEKIHIVLHKEFVPPEFLPVLNKNIIEFFIHKIPRLNEDFVYLYNMVPISPIKYEELFNDGLPCINFIDNEKFNDKSTLFNLANTYTSKFKNEKSVYTKKTVYPELNPIPLLKSICNDISNLNIPYFHKVMITHPAIKDSIFFWSDVFYCMSKFNESSIKTLSISDDNIDDIKDDIKFIHFDPLMPSNLTAKEISTLIVEKMNTLLPDKCKYEN